MALKLMVLRTSALCMGKEAVDHECPVRFRHSAFSCALRKAEHRSFHLACRGLAFGSTVQPFDESIVGFEIGFQGNLPDARSSRR